MAVVALVATPVRLRAERRRRPTSRPCKRVVDDYIGLYTKERLPEWKALFLPSFTADVHERRWHRRGRTLEEFYESQRAGFARGPMSETLHDLRITREGRLAHAFAGFDFTSGGSTRRGQLMLLLIESKGAVQDRGPDLQLSPSVRRRFRCVTSTADGANALFADRP